MFRCFGCFGCFGSDGPLGECVQCGGKIDGTECRHLIGDRAVWLHPACERFFQSDPPLVPRSDRLPADDSYPDMPDFLYRRAQP